MIAGLDGTLEQLNPDSAIIKVSGVSFQVYTPASTLGRLGSIGDRVRLHTYLHWKEDSTALYGFTTPQELDLFKMLIAVSGVGPKSALSMLSSLTPDDLVSAILSSNVDLITQAPGIGKKTASRVILDLKGKLEKGWGGMVSSYPTGRQRRHSRCPDQSGILDRRCYPRCSRGAKFGRPYSRGQDQARPASPGSSVAAARRRLSRPLSAFLESLLGCILLRRLLALARSSTERLTPNHHLYPERLVMVRSNSLDETICGSLLPLRLNEFLQPATCSRWPAPSASHREMLDANTLRTRSFVASNP